MAANLSSHNARAAVSLSIDGVAPQAASTPGLLAQLRAHYPSANLVSELLQIYEGSFVVRVVVEVEGRTLVSALAAAEQIELAEDAAQLRVMALLAIMPSWPTASELTDRVLPMANEVTVITPIAVEQHEVEPELASLAKVPEVKVPEVPMAKVPEVKTPAAPVVETMLLPIALPLVPLPAASLNGVTNALVAPADFSGADEPIDLSDAIAQIGAEIERIGWDKKQGSAHLQKTYHKRTRAELTEEEIGRAHV